MEPVKVPCNDPSARLMPQTLRRLHTCRGPSARPMQRTLGSVHSLKIAQGLALRSLEQALDVCIRASSIRCTLCKSRAMDLLQGSCEGPYARSMRRTLRRAHVLKIAQGPALRSREQALDGFLRASTIRWTLCKSHAVDLLQGPCEGPYARSMRRTLRRTHVLQIAQGLALRSREQALDVCLRASTIGWTLCKSRAMDLLQGPCEGPSARPMRGTLCKVHATDLT